MENIKYRLTTGWNFQRVLFVVIGSFVIVQAIVDGQWMFAAFGAYFASMGLFGYGCASGSCKNQ